MNFFKLNIYDLNYEHTCKKLGLLNLPAENNPKPGILIRILSLFKYLILTIPFKKKIKNIKKNKIIFFAYANNEIKSMRPIQNKIDKSYLVGQKKFKNDFPFFTSYLLAICFIPVVLINFLFCKDPYIKRSFYYVFNGFCLAYAFAITLPIWLRKIQPKKIVISNQLSVYHRSLVASAHKIGIETVFMQHASVTDNHPPLTNFNTVLLEGKDSLEKYQKNGCNNLKIFLCGIPKSDKYFKFINEKNTVKNVGICTNGIDDINAYEKLINKVSQIKKLKNIYMRPHLADRKFDKWQKIASNYGLKFSNSRTTNSFDFLCEVDLIISGDSNIHLEAATMNVSSIYFDSSNLNLDWYGFRKNGLIDYFSDIDSTIARIRELMIEKKNIRSRAKQYIETINTDFDGCSTQLLAKIINDCDVKDYFTRNIDENNNLIYKPNK